MEDEDAAKTQEMPVLEDDTIFSDIAAGLLSDCEWSTDGASEADWADDEDIARLEDIAGLEGLNAGPSDSESEGASEMEVSDAPVETDTNDQTVNRTSSSKDATQAQGTQAQGGRGPKKKSPFVFPRSRRSRQPTPEFRQLSEMEISKELADQTSIQRYLHNLAWENTSKVKLKKIKSKTRDPPATISIRPSFLSIYRLRTVSGCGKV